MNETFEQLGVRAELQAAIEAAGYDRPSALQRASVPLIRRGSNVLLHAASGSGATTGALLAVLDSLAEGESSTGVAALIVTSTELRATRLADAAARFGSAIDVRAAAAGGGWTLEHASILAGTPADLMHGVQRSAVKLDGVRIIVIDGAAQILALGGAQQLEALLQIVPRDAQRVIVTAALTEEITRFVEAHARRALNVPARSTEPAAASHPDGDVGYIVAAGMERLDALSRLLGEHADGTRAVIVRGSADLQTVAGALARRGFATGSEPGAVRLEIARFRPADADVVIGFGAPLDSLAFSKIFLSGDTFIVAAGELAHLRSLAAEENLELRPIDAPRQDSAALTAFRAQIRAALVDEDIDAQLLVLEPLFDERSPAEVAAALSALLRRSRSTSADASADPRVAAQPSRQAAGPADPAGTAAFVRLFISVGQRDNVRPADIVGAIAGEANVPGAQIGKVEIRDTFTVVEVPADAAARVIRTLNGTTMRGRSVRVDYDRKGGSRESGTGRGEGGARGGPGGRGGAGGRGGPGGARGGAGGGRGGPRGATPTHGRR